MTKLRSREVAAGLQNGADAAARTAALVGLLAMAYVLMLPVSNNVVLYPVLTLLGVIAAIATVRHAPRLPRAAVALSVAILALGVYGTSLAVINGNDGLLFALLVYFLAPMLFLTCAWASSLSIVRYFLRVAATATALIAGALLLFVGGEAGAIPQIIPGWLEDFTGLGATFSGGSSQARSYNLSSLAALGPLWAASLVVRRDALLPHWGVRAVCAALAAGAALVSSRDAIVLVIILAPFTALVVRAALRPAPTELRASPRLAAGVMLLAAAGSGIGAVAAPVLLSTGPVTRTLEAVSAFFTGEPTDSGGDQSIRSDQAAALVRAWSMNPLLGSGFGASVPEYYRTSERPWVLELQYHLLLVHVGLIGILLVAAMVVCAVIILRQAARRGPELLPTLTIATTTAIAMLVANATNPYLQAPGHMWALFLPLAVAAGIENHRNSAMRLSLEAQDSTSGAFTSTDVAVPPRPTNA